ncbi:VanW family protein [Euzebya tangerina]|uniref:VanW family protein n=1 Tax=Euzebya tangerina TaxID=591198 RepID=UPI000E30CBEF|nr:VanW family protein [Euzebya tangerina]
MVTRSIGQAAAPRTRINWGRAAAALVVLVLLLAASTLVAFRTIRDGVLTNLEVARPGSTPVPVGGLSDAELDTVVQDLAVGLRQRQLEITHGGRVITMSAPELGLDLDIDATIEAIRRRGRQANPVAALGDHLIASATTLVVNPVAAIDETRLRQAGARIAREVGLEAPLGAVRIAADGQASVELPPPSEVIDVEALRRVTVDALLGSSAAAVGAVEVPTLVVTPAIDDDDRALLESEAERAASAPITITTPLADWTLDADTLAGLLAVRADHVDGTTRAAIVIDPAALLDVLPFDPLALTTAPTDASIDVSSGTPQLVPSQTGFVFDLDIVAEQLLELATAVGPRAAALEGRQIQPDLPDAVVAELGITQQVAAFTTDHPCCEGRVQNIHRIADLVDGAIVRPGETFSLNETVGPRTLANGFVEGGAIESGEFVDQVGGGVSQFTTTLFNAVFFGGYQIEEFQPHSYYLPRYPLGREATLNFDPPIDLQFTNNSPDGILIATSYTDTQITVTLYSSVFAAVESATSDRYGFSEPEEERRPTPELPAGEERVEQDGAQGFTVDVTRDITYVDGRRESETYTTVYRAQPRIVLVGTGTGGAETPTDDASEPVTSAEPETLPEPDISLEPTITPEPIPEPGPVQNTPEPVPDPPTSPGPPTPPESPGDATPPPAPVEPPAVTPPDAVVPPEPLVDDSSSRRHRAISVLAHNGRS